MESADQALLNGEIDILIAACHQNERPLAGLAGILDWRFHGEISRFVRNGIVTGKVGECVYFPYSRFGKTYRVLLVGAGHSNTPGARAALPPETIRSLAKNLASLKFEKVGISRTDAGNLPDEHLKKQLKGVSLWIAT